MKTYALFALICLSLFAPSLFGQTPAPVPEDARRHFVMGATLFKDAKTADDYSVVVSEFKQATELAPQWPDARYNLGLAKEAAGDYTGAMADLKLYLGFKLSDTEARAVQDKIYALEAKAGAVAKKQKQAEDEANSPEAQMEKFIKSVDGGVWRLEHSDNKQYENGRLDKDYCCAGADQAVGHTYIAISGRTIRFYVLSKPTFGSNGMVNGTVKNIDYDPSATPTWTATITGRKFKITRTDGGGTINDEITISDDGQSISDEETFVFTVQGNNYMRGGPMNFVRMK
jgi:hypothetical protein